MCDLIEIPTSELARAREAIRLSFGSDDVETWLTRWICSVDRIEDYVARELEEIIPGREHWLLAYVDAPTLARDWTDCLRVHFALDRRGRFHVFAGERVDDLDPTVKR